MLHTIWPSTVTATGPGENTVSATPAAAMPQSTVT